MLLAASQKWGAEFNSLQLQNQVVITFSDNNAKIFNIYKKVIHLNTIPKLTHAIQNYGTIIMQDHTHTEANNYLGTDCQYTIRSYCTTNLPSNYRASLWVITVGQHNKCQTRSKNYQYLHICLVKGAISGLLLRGRTLHLYGATEGERLR